MAAGTRTQAVTGNQRNGKRDFGMPGTGSEQERLADLEVRVLAGTASEEEREDFRIMAAAHAAWTITRPGFRELVAGLPVAVRVWLALVSLAAGCVDDVDVAVKLEDAQCAGIRADKLNCPGAQWVARWAGLTDEHVRIDGYTAEIAAGEPGNEQGEVIASVALPPVIREFVSNFDNLADGYLALDVDYAAEAS